MGKQSRIKNQEYRLPQMAAEITKLKEEIIRLTKLNLDQKHQIKQLERC